MYPETCNNNLRKMAKEGHLLVEDRSVFSQKHRCLEGGGRGRAQSLYLECYCQMTISQKLLYGTKGAAERTPRFGRVIASGGERVQWCGGARRRTAVYVPFSVYTMAWCTRAFIVEEFIKKMAGRR